MKHRRSIQKVMALLLTLTMLCGLAVPAAAAGSPRGTSVSFEETDGSSITAGPSLRQQTDSTETSFYQSGDTVRVSILLEEQPALERYSLEAVPSSQAAVQSYRSQLERQQAQLASTISRQALNGSRLDVVWNLTLAANLISANVKYGQIEDILDVDGVKDVVVEQRYEPMVLSQSEANDPAMATSGAMIGSAAAYSAGYYGAGSRIAVIDTGTDTDHQSFNEDAFLYAVAEDAERADKNAADYDLLDKDEIAGKLAQLNAYKENSSISADRLYGGAKLPFGYNYVDQSYDITHDGDSQGEHGSHVAGIATANRYLKDGDSYVSALDSVHVQGVAPDAQLLTMKVFGKNGGAYDSDYMAAIEDAIVLGADAINLSLGSGGPGNASNSTAAYQAIMDRLTNSGVVVCISAGNSDSWAANSQNGGYLYTDDVSMQTNGSPGSYTNSLSVASADNDGTTGEYLTVNGSSIFYTDGSGPKNSAFSTLAGQTLEYVLIDGYGTERDFTYLEDEVDLTGKVLICSRGSINFSAKANNAAKAGAAATIIYNNTTGTFGMDLSDYSYTAPCVNISQADGAILKAAAEKNEGWSIDYYTGKFTVADNIGTQVYHSENYNVSSFSSWGIPGDLALKPEITAPGGSIYSINGAVKGGQAYETMSGTSMAAPQVSGMAALVAQYIRETGKTGKTGLSARTLAQSLLMSTAQPMLNGSTGSYWSVLQQGAGLANVGDAIAAETYVTMGKDATASYADGKVKAELGADDARNGAYTFSCTLTNLTDKAQSYALSADLFTQDIFTYGGVSYLDTATTPLASSAVFTVDGQTLSAGSIPDFDGNGSGDAADVDALLAYVAGSRESITNSDKADFDGDGKITSYDAYQWLQRAGLAATVPASGSVTVSVTLTLTDKSQLSAYPNGAYIEGYVFAKALPTAEGTVGVSHSIPVLGYYGSWSAPSMFEKGSASAYASGSETRTPYVGSEYANYVAIQYAGRNGSYYFGGNPILTDETYDPARNAINSLNGDKLTKAGYTLIRNAAKAQLSLNSTDGTDDRDWTQDLSGLDAAYYYVNGGRWVNTGYAADIHWTLANAKEGSTYILRLQAATEYDVNDDGSVNWGSLGAGSKLEIPFTIDNTAPTLNAASLTGDQLTAASGTKTLTLSVTENQYLAAALLYTADGSTCLRTIDPKQTTAGVVPELTLTTDGLADGVYLLQLYDYAMNVSTYRLFLGQDATDTAESVTVSPAGIRLLPGMSQQLTASVLPVSVADSTVTWSSSDDTVATVDENGTVTAVAEGKCTVTATSNLTGTVSGSCEVEVFALSKTLNAVVWGKDEDAQWASFDTSTLPAYTTLTSGAQSVKPVAVTYDENGVLYAADMESDGSGATLYTVDPTNEFAATEVGSTDACFFADLAQAPTLGCLIAVYGPYLVAVDKTDGSVQGALELYSNAMVGIAYCGSFYSSYNKCWLDSYLLIDSAGNVYRQNLTLLNGQYSYTDDGDSGFLFSTGAGVNAMDYFSSAYYDGSYLYWSVYDQDTNAARIFAIDVTSESCYDLGSFDENVWPVAGLFELNGGSVSGGSALKDILGVEDAQLQSDGFAGQVAQTPRIAMTGGLNSVVNGIAPQSASEIVTGDNGSTVIVQLTAQDADGRDVSSHSGKLTVSYDASKLTLAESGVTVYADHSGVKLGNGEIVIAYADLDGFAAGDAVAALRFTVNAEDAELTVAHQETDAALNGTHTETLPVTAEASTHLNATHVKKVDATCVSEGNIEYWYCADCGKYFRDAACTREIANGQTGTVSKVKPHVDTRGLTEVKAAAATCTDDGYKMEHWYCELCGKRFSFDEDEWTLTELDADEVVIPALGGEHLRTVRDSKPATTEENGYTGDIYCSRCGILLEKGRVIPKLTTSTLDEALNVEGGSLHFETSGEYPWVVAENDGEAYAVSTNETTGTTSGAVTTRIHLEKGQALTFQWKASGASYVDAVTLTVNGAGMAVQYVQDEGDSYFGTPEDDEFTWVTGIYAAAAAGEYAFSWSFKKGPEDEGYDGGRACLDDVQVVDAEMTTVTFTAGEHGKFTGESASLTGGSFSTDRKSYTFSVPVGYKLQAADIPTVVPDDGYQLLSWFQGDTNWAVVLAGKYVKGETLYTAKFAKSGSGTASVTLESHNVFPDGYGYQMLLDSKHEAAKYYSSMNIIATTDYRELADYTLPNVPINADGHGLQGSDAAIAQVKDGDVTISIPAGMYDWAILYPYLDGDQYLLMAMDLDYPTYVDDFNFAPGYTYHFTAYVNEDGRHDSVKLEITEGAAPVDEVKNVTVRFEAGEHGTISGITEYSVLSTTALRPGKTPKVTADKGYFFTGWVPSYQGGVTVKGDVTYTAQYVDDSNAATVILEARGIREKARAVITEYYAAMGLSGDVLKKYVESALQKQNSYAMLLDADATTLSDSTFTIYQDAWMFQVSEDLSQEQMNAFEYFLPEDFDGKLASAPMLDGTDEGGEISIKVPAGTYDMVALTRTTSPTETYFSSLCNVDSEDFAKGYGEYTFESGKTYRFTVDYSLEKVKYGQSYMDYPCELLRLTVTDSEPENPDTPDTPVTPVTPVTPGKPSQPEQPPLPFTDVDQDHWYYSDVVYAYGKGLIRGVMDTLFGADVTMTRAQAATILYRLAGSPAVTGKCPFRDVASGSYYEDAVTWAAAQGVVLGCGGQTFRPNDNISRQQLAAILYRYAALLGRVEGTDGSLSDFTDAGKVADYAKDAMLWCSTNDVIRGTPDKRLAPADTVTRAQAVAMLHRFCLVMEQR